MPADEPLPHSDVPVDSQPDLPVDPDTPVPPHVRPVAWILVLFGALLGAGLRIGIEHNWPASSGQWPWATFGINIVGSWLLGVILETLARLGADTGWRQNVRMLAATGVCSTFTTYSTLALEISELGRDGHSRLALAYGVGSVIVGVVAAWVGIVTAKHARSLARARQA